MSDTGGSAIPKKILVPIDFSASSRQALDAAAELAEKVGAELHLFSAIPEFPDWSVPDAIAEVRVLEEGRQEAEARFAASRDRLAARGIPVNFSVKVSNNVTEAILKAIQEQKADLMVIATHGISGWSRVFGSIAEKVIRLAPCPILLLRTPRPEPGTELPAGPSPKWEQ